MATRSVSSLAQKCTPFIVKTEEGINSESKIRHIWLTILAVLKSIISWIAPTKEEKAHKAIEELALRYARDPIIPFVRCCLEEAQMTWKEMYEGAPYLQEVPTWDENQFLIFFQGQYEQVSNEQQISPVMLLKDLLATKDLRLIWWAPLLEECQSNATLLAGLLAITFLDMNTRHDDPLKCLGIRFHTDFAKRLQENGSVELALRAFCETQRPSRGHTVA